MQLGFNFGDEVPKPRKKRAPTQRKAEPVDHLNPEAILTRRLKSREHLRRLEKVTIGATIRKLRLRNRMKQADLARKLKTTQSVIARIEGGRQNITLELLHRIGEVFGKKVQIKLH